MHESNSFSQRATLETETALDWVLLCIRKQFSFLKKNHKQSFIQQPLQDYGVYISKQDFQ